MRFGVNVPGPACLGLPYDRAVPSTPLSTSLKLPAKPRGVRVECASESASQALLCAFAYARGLRPLGRAPTASTRFEFSNSSDICRYSASPFLGHMQLPAPFGDYAPFDDSAPSDDYAPFDDSR